MNDKDVRIITLAPFRAICFHGFGESPELQALGKAKAWVDKTGLLKEGKAHRIFGFNNPDPSPGSPNYGYDIWVTVDDTVQPGNDKTMINFGGGLYAVTGVTGVEQIGPTWQAFVHWREMSRYQFAGDHQWLEEHFNPFGNLDELRLDLFMPIRE